MRAPRRLSRRVALSLLHQLVIGIGCVGFGGAVFQARLEPVEFRRGRGHVGVGAARGAVGLRGGTAEIVDVGGDVTEAAHTRGRRWRWRRSGIRRAARGRAIAPERRLRRSRLAWRIETRSARRTLGIALIIAAERRTVVARRRRGRTGPRWRGRLGRCGRVVFGRTGAGPAERIAAAATTPGAATGTRGLAGALGGLGFDLADGLFQRQPLAGNLGFGERRLHAAELRDQGRARPFIERAPAFAGSVGVQGGNSAGDQRIVISHFSSIIRASW